MGALDEQENLTQLGKDMSELPIEPIYAVLLFEAF